MKSPFPGMDPYLERFWNDVHGPLITYIKDTLNDRLPPRYRATMQERVVIADVEQPVPGVRYPDVAVVEVPMKTTSGTAVMSRRAILTSPARLNYRGEELTQFSIEIVDTKFGQAVVTAIEVLSPENKRTGDGMVQYERKKRDYRNGRIGIVEIDLLREGKWMFDFPRRLLSPDQVAPYNVMVQRPGKVGEWELYGISLRQELPVIGIPLRPADEDVALELQPLMERVYHNGRFPIDYSEPCDPPLDEADARWADELLRAAGRR